MKISKSKWVECILPREDKSDTAINVSFLLDAPAGKHGFLQSENGHFCFENGRRIRFWGINVARFNALPSKSEARLIAARLAKYGINLVRFHDIDTYIIDPAPDHTQSLIKAALDKVDYFIHVLEQRGIYIYLDLLDYRKFKPGDGVRASEKLGRGAKYLSTFDPRMIMLQKQYAQDLLTHYNPYVGKRYVDDPGIALLEITNENSIFMTFWEHKDSKAAWGSIWQSGVPEPYYSELKRRWNKWLVEKYGFREKLVKSWSSRQEPQSLADGEDPRKGTVEFPPVVTCSDNKHAGARLDEFSAFAYECQNAYYQDMVKHLRTLGVKIPITGTNDDVFSPANLKSYTMMDFSGDHHYWDHPHYGNGALHFHNQPMVNVSPFENGRETLVHTIAPTRLAGKPLVVSEWNYVWPNEWRCEGVLSTAAYACLQDWDGFIIHNYEGPIIPLDLWPRKKCNDIRHFKIASDPAIMGLMPAAALLFHRHDVKAAKSMLEIEYSRKDAFTNRVWGAIDQISPYKSLPFISGIQGRFFDQAVDNLADVIIPSGLSDLSYLPKGYRNKHLMLLKNSSGNVIRKLYPKLKLIGASECALSFREVMWPNKTIVRELKRGIRLSSIPRDALAVGVDSKRNICAGFIDGRNCVAPDMEITSENLARLFLSAGKYWGIFGARYKLSSLGSRLTSDTGELTRDFKQGVFTINSPRVQSAVGFLKQAGKIALANLIVECETEYCSITVSSLDGKPISVSRHLLVTTVGKAENRGQLFADQGTHWELRYDEKGAAPVIIEPVKARIAINTGAIHRCGKVFALDPTGKRIQKMKPTWQNDWISLRIGRGAIYYEVCLE